MAIELIKNIQIPPPRCVKRSSGFSLAEIILALVIIGIVSSITIPTIMNNIQQYQLNVGAQNAFNMLEQAVEQIQATNGYIHVGTGTGGDIPTETLMRSDFCNVLQCVQTGNNRPVWENFVPLYSLYKASTATESLVAAYSGNAPIAILNNGNFLLFYNRSSCDENIGNGLKGCGWVTIDTNGAAGPNMWGYDLLTFYVAQNTNGVYSIVPSGGANDGWYGTFWPCTAGGTNEGEACTYPRVFNPNGMP